MDPEIELGIVDEKRGDVLLGKGHFGIICELFGI
jgi:hypothetical protein